MEVKIDDKRDNPLLDRTDVHFTVRHDGEKTPGRDQIKKEVAGALGAKTELTVIDRLETAYGQGASRGFAKVYTSLDRARYHERDYIQKRNGIYEEPKKAEGGDS